RGDPVLVALFALKRHLPPPLVRANNVELLAIERQEKFAHAAESQVLTVDFECLRVQPGSFRSRNVTWVGAPKPRRGLAISTVQPELRVISAGDVVHVDRKTQIDLKFITRVRVDQKQGK